MKKAFLGLATFALVTTTATAQDASIWSHQLGNDSAIDSGWVVSIPTQTSEWFSVGGDTTYPIGCSFLTNDAYTTPAGFLGTVVNWGLRINVILDPSPCH